MYRAKIDGEHNWNIGETNEKETELGDYLEYEDGLDQDNDASMILDYELAETSRQYFTDQIDTTMGLTRLTSGKKPCYHLDISIKIRLLFWLKNLLIFVLIYLTSLSLCY